jgi:NADPH-dependent curcumin reductase CurA
MRDDVNCQWTVAARPHGNVKDSDFAYREAPIPEPGPGEFLLKTLYLSLAPVMRMYMQEGGSAGEAPLALGDVIHGRGVGQVVKSHHPDFAVGDIVHGQIGWQTYKATKASPRERFFKYTARDLPVSLGIGVLGMTGFSAYCGFFDCGFPQPGDTVVVSGAAGGVGSIVVQIAKAVGCGDVIGIAGGAEKCAMVRDLGADATIDYKSDDVRAKLKELCPRGIDVYFDNVGGDILEACIDAMAFKGRIVQCGAISEYTKAERRGPRNYTQLGVVRANLNGFFVYNHPETFPIAERTMARWIREGKLRYVEDIVDGFENMPRALARLYEGKNKGKQIVRVRGEPETR